MGFSSKVIPMDLPLSFHKALLGVNRFMDDMVLRDVAARRRFMEWGGGRLPFPASVKEEAAMGLPVPGTWFTAGRDDGPTTLYLHGGGYMHGSTVTHRALMARIALTTGGRVLGIDYRLAPEHPFPAAVEDALAVARWLLDQGVAPEDLAMMGDSAGGGLTLATLLCLREEDLPMPRCAALLCPWADVAGSGNPVFTQAYAAAADPAHPLLSPVNADLSGLPPLLIQAGSGDEAYVNDARVLAANAVRDGVPVVFNEYDGCFHVWQVFAATLPQARTALHEIGRFVEQPQA